MKPISPTTQRSFLTPQQQAALISGDVASIQSADDAALAEAILASLAEIEKQTVQDNTVTDVDLVRQAQCDSLRGKGEEPVVETPFAAMLQRQLENTGKLRSWLDANGFDIVKNRGGGHNDCLLISLLQHATGDYQCEHAADVKDCRAFLNTKDPSIARNDALPSMSDAIGKLIERLNQDKGCKLRIAIVAPGLKGEPTYHFYGQGERYAMIFDQSGHYEAIVPRRSPRASAT